MQPGLVFFGRAGGGGGGGRSPASSLATLRFTVPTTGHCLVAIGNIGFEMQRKILAINHQNRPCMFELSTEKTMPKD